MKPMAFYVKAIWDAENGVYFSESDIVGLHIEAATLEEFEAAAMELGPQLVFENHVTKRELTQRSIMDLIPWIQFRAPTPNGAVAA
ncbi:MAG: DUF1902 domain-containing protein [Paracoccaceae bacterium]